MAAALMLMLVRPDPARATALTFDGYALGVSVAHVTVDFNLGDAGYGMLMRYRVTGLLGMIAGGAQTTTTAGVWQASSAAARIFRSDGAYLGSPRHVAIDFAASPPAQRILDPADDGRDVIQPVQTKGSVDPLSAMAVLVHRIQTTGRCDGQLTVFDGRRLMRMTSHDAGPEPVIVDGQQYPQAQRCNLEGVLLAGFKRSDKVRSQTPKKGSVWFAPVDTSGVKLPVRVTVETPWVGTVTLNRVSFETE